ncbi:IclR family transcriptional regulator [Rhodococcus ruber Chol-4]|uniref:Regulator of catechol degradative operon n=2 Tax=Nocardiaceae TaxID=85025 RepID=A0A098BGU0_9NOCA|nr:MULTISPECIES: IclR family transcriptional regulator C-terminal domain-containing protein [Rhodococcus]ABB82575.1 regulator of catechol degradative operon [Nocardia sp. C-14-1]MDO2378766.1 IclR family transcriptional regulator C-terminal domain-containing protein [Rhodococcus ruber]RIK11673.1 MAG: IclR family transcriptional regulator [Acidobacteriota bacterium]ATQ29725.1 IclR family transcriptional regulator [Rhodococcus ruber]AUM18745.1 IclR family transcriptional regulator [Rhodococcus ru
MPSQDRDFVQSIERGFAVLLAFDERHPTPSLAELAAKTDLSRPAVRRILLTLQKLGYVTSTGSRWSLTPRVLSIGQHYSASHALVEAAMPRLVEIAEYTGESASLGVLDGAEVVYAARVPVRRIMSINVSVGTRVPAYATSMGRALLAWAPEELVEQVVAATRFEKLATATVRNADELRAELARVRAQGYALTSAELEEGLISAAAPVRDATGTVVGVLACSTSTARHTPGEFRELAAECLMKSAHALGADLGYRG